jgi:exo-1,4-beta-D-glucosaminidase
MCLALAAATCLSAGAQQRRALREGWKIQSSEKVAADGAALSTDGASVEGWYNATVPATVMGALTRDNGMYKELLDASNYKEADRTPFDASWWYRTTFGLSDLKGKRVLLQFDGLSYRANIWLNGELVAPKEEVFGPFSRYSFDVTEMVGGENVLAVEVFRAQIGEPNIGFVDWNPRPLDESMGIFRDVTVEVTGAVDVANSWVRTDVDTETLREAKLTVETDVTNNSAKSVKGVLEGTIGDIAFSRELTVAAGEKQHVVFTPEDVAALRVQNPRLWWSAGMGEPEMYEMEVKFVVGKKREVSDSECVAFGIREIESYFTPEGHRGYMVNGKKVLVKGAGWTDDIFLRDTPESNERQVKYVKDMGLNTIRFENIWGTSRNIYEMCDKYGILALVGWSCQWEWEGYIGIPDDEFGTMRTAADIDLMTRFLHDQVLWLRNHPSIIAWYGGSDKLMHPEIERRYMALLPTIDNRPFVPSAKKLTSEVTGPSGMKMYGPYDYVGPNYWFVDNRLGGAYGFNTETGPGAQLPVLESIVKFIPENELWPMGPSWDYHCTTSAGTMMNSMTMMTEVVTEKYGAARDLKDYLRKADLVSWESTKSMFEAFRANKPATTGLIQWMLNSAWPGMYWQLYDYYGVPNASYYAVKKANSPYQLVYNYKDSGIYIVNEKPSNTTQLKAIVKTYGIDSQLLSEQEITGLSAEANSSARIAEVDKSAKNTFVALALYDGSGRRIAENFYALSATDDVHDWESRAWETTPVKEYADFRDLENIAPATLEVRSSAGKKGGNDVVTVELRNTSSVIAFFTSMKLKDSRGEMVVPALWSDNYVSVLPGETRSFECVIDSAEGSVDVGSLSVEIEGWNVAAQRLAAR